MTLPPGYQHILISPRVPKELISRFVKLCPTCQIRRGMNRNSPHDEAKSLPDFNDTDSPPDDDESSPKSRHESTISTQESCLLDMPTQLVNGSTAFRSQNRWLSGFQPPHSAYDGIYSPTTTNGEAPSFSTVNGMSSFDQHAVHSSSHMATMSNASPSHSRPMSSHEAHFKQDSRYCYD